MLNISLIGLSVVLSAGPLDCPRPPLIGDWPAGNAAAQPLGLHCVRLSGFLGQHVDASNDSLLACLESPIPRAFDARATGLEPPPETRRLATDSDFYKWLEGACYGLAYDPSRAELRIEIEKYAKILTKLQREDGYLGTMLSPAHPFDEKVRHDLYVAGHFIEAAIAHAGATGSRTLLEAAIRLADFYLRAFQADHPYFRLIGQEHPEIELALVRLGRATGESRFVDFSAELTRRAELAPHLREVRAGASRRHAVRLCYQLTGAAELFLQTGRSEFRANLEPLWHQIVDARMYLTGGIGYNEVVPERAFDLPQTLASNPHRDIAETCASISMMMFAWRMHGLTGEAQMFDVIERILYNHCLGALSPDHKANFYYNPLRRVGDLTGKTDHRGDPVRRTRLPAIHSTTCCLPNAWRFFGQLPEYVFSARPGRLEINLFTSATARHRIDETDVQIEMQTAYPQEGHVEILVRPARPATFELALRIPSWCERASVRVNGGDDIATASGNYHGIAREWHPGDRVTLNLPMKPEVVRSRPEIEANRGHVAFRRGPLIYCLERQDAAGLDLEHLAVVLREDTDPVRSVWDESLGFHVLKIMATLNAPGTQPGVAPPPREITLIPFYYRANRADDTRWLTWIPLQ